jgi:hypothetical protein
MYDVKQKHILKNNINYIIIEKQTYLRSDAVLYFLNVTLIDPMK